MKHQSLIRSTNGFLRPFRSEIAWRRERLLNTAAAVVDNTPVSAKRSGKKIPRAERKALVEAYVNEYRAMNAGKFPGTKNTQKQFGGSYYTVRAILQELEHNSKSPVTTAGKIATVGGTAEPNEISVVEKIEMPAERSSSYLQQNNSDSSKRMVDESIRSNGDKITADVGTSSQSVVDLNLQPQFHRVSIVVEDRGDNDEFLRKEVSEDPSLADKTSTCHSVKASSTIAHPCEVPVTLRSTEISETEELSAKASESDDLTRTSNAASSELRVGSSKLEDDGNPKVGDYHVLMDRAVVNDKVGVSAETGSTSQRVFDNNSCQREVEMSEITKAVERTPEEVSGTDKLTGSPEKTSTANMNWGDKYENLESREETQKSSMVEKTEAVEVSKEDCHESSAKSYHGSKNFGRGAGHGDESDEFPKITPQKEIVVKKSSLWGNLKSLASDFISIWR